MFSVSGGVEPGTFNLIYSVTFIAIVIIGGGEQFWGHYLVHFSFH